MRHYLRSIDNNWPPPKKRLNAHLAEAAQDLHDALVGLVDYLEYMGVPEDCEDKYNQALQAIAKAREEL